MRIKIIQALPCLLMLSPINGVASQQAITEHANYRLNKFSIHAAVGYLGGESNEYVYGSSDEKLSQLNWKFNSAAIIKAAISFDFTPLLTVNLNGWNTIGNNQALMDDYDWMVPYQSKWSDWSHHTNTDLNYANNVDLNFRQWFLQNQNYKLGATVGYEQTSFDF